MSGDSEYSAGSESMYTGKPGEVFSFDRQAPLYSNAGQLPSIIRPEESSLETRISLPDYSLTLPFERTSETE